MIATKGGIDGGGQDARPETLRRHFEESLARLRLERIDLHQLHGVDPDVPLDELAGELPRLREEGKVRHVSLSNVDVDQLHRAQAVVPIVSVQNEYSIGNRGDDPMDDECERQGIAYLPWSPLSGADPETALAWLLHRRR